jgi:hypothetical protein
MLEAPLERSWALMLNFECIREGMISTNVTEKFTRVYKYNYNIAAKTQQSSE